MNNQSKTNQLSNISSYSQLEALALDFSWSWNGNHCSDKVWHELDPELWELTHNPWVILQTSSRQKIENKLADPNFRRIVDQLIKDTSTAGGAAWFQKKHPKAPLSTIAYFSMEFMLAEALPIYSGGLGNVAGDQLKAASDLGVPVIGIGLLYQQGYFRQTIDINGEQKALYPYNSPEQLPIKPLRKEGGEWLRLEVHLPGWSMWLRAWEVKVGRTRLILLDSNDIANIPTQRGITSELYGGDSELRLLQELVLGIGGWRILNELGIKPEVCHLNEGHAAFATLERANQYMKASGAPFATALAVTRAGNLFTTHTAVPAGFDRFSPFLIKQYLKNYSEGQLGLSLEDFLALGRLNPQDSQEPFNMAYLAIRGSGAVNAVSRLHGKVSRSIFTSLFPRWPINEVPIGYVTNGIHTPSWQSIEAGNLWEEFSGKSCFQGSTEVLEKDIRKAPDLKIWQMRNESRKNLINYSRKQLTRLLESRGEKPEEVEKAKHIFDYNTLTLGFARRFATYKRPNLLLQDPERLIRILTNLNRPVQLILAGKAHPADKPGQEMIKQWMQFIKRPEVRPHVIFLSDYDVHLSECLVRGVDVWINTPRRPWEACGTSGMKVLVNGGLNLSELDGWWAEAYSPEVGWALGDGKEHDSDPAWDIAEANALYEILENQVVPQFYSRDADGMPSEWIAKIRESMARLTPRFCADRAVREYTENYYLPAAESYARRSADNGAIGKKIVAWENNLEIHWPAIRFSNIKVETNEKVHDFEIQVYLDDVDPDAVCVELYAEAGSEDPGWHEKMTRVQQLTTTPCTYVYRLSVPSTRPASEYTPRLIPYFKDASVPLEESKILWYH